MTTDDSITIKTAAPSSAGPQRRRTLGKGLGALLGEAAEDYAQLETPAAHKPAGASVSKVAIHLLSANFHQPRRHFTSAVLQELADSIREKGILQPILVRKHVSTPGQYEIIAGERRWRAAGLAGLAEVPVIIRDMTDAEAAEAALIENIQREDLTILEEAKAYQRLMYHFKHTQEEVAKLVGKSRAYIANTLRLLKLPDSIQEKVNEGLLTAGHARALLAASDDPELLERLAKGRGLSVREVEAAVQEKRRETGAMPAKGRLRDANTVALEKLLADHLGLKVSLTGRGQSGTLMVRYQSLDQLDDLIRKLCGSEVQV